MRRSSRHAALKARRMMSKVAKLSDDFGMDLEDEEDTGAGSGSGSGYGPDAGGEYPGGDEEDYEDDGALDRSPSPPPPPRRKRGRPRKQPVDPDAPKPKLRRTASGPCLPQALLVDIAMFVPDLRDILSMSTVSEDARMFLTGTRRATEEIWLPRLSDLADESGLPFTVCGLENIQRVAVLTGAETRRRFSYDQASLSDVVTKAIGYHAERLRAQPTVGVLLRAYRLDCERERRLEAQREALVAWRSRVNRVLSRRRTVELVLQFLQDRGEREQAAAVGMPVPTEVASKVKALQSALSLFDEVESGFKARPPSKKRELVVARVERVWERKEIGATVDAVLEHIAGLEKVLADKLAAWKARVRAVMDNRSVAKFALRVKTLPETQLSPEVQTQLSVVQEAVDTRMEKLSSVMGCRLPPSDSEEEALVAAAEACWPAVRPAVEIIEASFAQPDKAELLSSWSARVATQATRKKSINKALHFLAHEELSTTAAKRGLLDDAAALEQRLNAALQGPFGADLDLLAANLPGPADEACMSEMDGAWAPLEPVLQQLLQVTQSVVSVLRKPVAALISASLASEWRREARLTPKARAKLLRTHGCNPNPAHPSALISNYISGRVGLPAAFVAAMRSCVNYAWDFGGHRAFKLIDGKVEDKLEKALVEAFLKQTDWYPSDGDEIPFSSLVQYLGSAEGTVNSYVATHYRPQRSYGWRPWRRRFFRAW